MDRLERMQRRAGQLADMIVCPLPEWEDTRDLLRAIQRAAVQDGRLLVEAVPVIYTEGGENG